MIKLTKREAEVVALYLRLGKWRAVAKELNLSARTIQGHQESAMRKLGAATSVELVTLAIRRGLVNV